MMKLNGTLTEAPRAEVAAATLRVRVNGTEHEFPAGDTVLEALGRIGASVPTLCHDPRLEPTGACRMCAVEVAGRAKPVMACTTPLEGGMEILTDTPALERERRALLEMQARRYPPAPVRVFPEKPFHALLRRYGLAQAALGTADPARVDDSHPYIRVDMSRCIDCMRCVRICDEVEGQGVWQATRRGIETEIRPGTAPSLLASRCVSCGACVDTCPSGAIEDRTRIEDGLATDWVRTTCAYCGVGCELNAGVRENRVVVARPVLESPVSKGHLCVKGRYAHAYVDAPDRVTTPMVRKWGEWRAVSWGEAIAHAAAALANAVERHGPGAVGVLGSARATNEDNYLTQKLARVALGTNNVDSCARVCHAPTAAAMAHMLGTGASTGCYDDIERAGLIFVFGANATENHPVIGARIRQAARRGARLIVADPRRIALADEAAMHLALKPGSNLPLLLAMAHVILEDGLDDAAFVEARVLDFEAFRELAHRWTPQRAALETGIEAGLIREAARVYATSGPALIVHGLGATEHTQGTDAVSCLVNLALLTGNLGRAGAGVLPLRGQNNVQGAAHMGCEPNHLTGYPLLEEGRQRFEHLWGVPLPSRPGLGLMEMMEAARAGKLKVLWAIGYDVALTNPDARDTRRALDRLDALIVQDLFMNETAREFGSVFLPATSAFEKDGTFMNAERRVSRVRRAVGPRGGSMPDWEILCAMGRALGHAEAFAFESAEAVWNEVREAWPGGAGMSYARLERGGLQWPCRSEDDPGSVRLHVGAFTSGPRAALHRPRYAPSPEQISEAYPLLLVTGRTLYAFNAGTMTGRTRNLELRPEDTLDVSPADASRLALTDGERVTVRSRYGAARLPVRVDDRVKPGELFATFHTAGTLLNRVTGPHADAVTGTPEYKRTAVRVERD